MDLIVIGGGCYGCYHTRQLLKAQHRGCLACQRIVIVDHNVECRARSEFAGESLVEFAHLDWDTFLRDYLGRADPASEDRLVPTPFASHLLFTWLQSVAAALPGVEARRGRCDVALDLPYNHTDEQGNQFISAAGWLCPATCIEPALCPAIKSQRTWELGDIVRAGVAADPDRFTGVEIFTNHHFVWGIGTIPVADLARARQRLEQRLATGVPHRLVVGTVSSCHGVLSLLDSTSRPA